jgi:hypothetical protein
MMTMLTEPNARAMSGSASPSRSAAAMEWAAARDDREVPDLAGDRQVRGAVGVEVGCDHGSRVRAYPEVTGPGKPAVARLEENVGAVMDRVHQHHVEVAIAVQVAARGRRGCALRDEDPVFLEPPIALSAKDSCSPVEVARPQEFPISGADTRLQHGFTRAPSGDRSHDSRRTRRAAKQKSTSSLAGGGILCPFFSQ